MLLDALGTLVELQPPAPRLQRLLRESGFEVSEERAAAGFMAEIAYYLDHHLEGRTASASSACATAALRRCGGRSSSPDLDHATARRAMLGALEFRPYPDVLPALGELRERGLTVVVASNWDCSLPEWLGPAGIIELVDGVVTSAEVGRAEAEHARVRARACDCGRGARRGAPRRRQGRQRRGGRRARPGCAAMLLQREGDPPAGVEAIRSLRELAALL